jgi:hypothetical protein
VASVRYELIGVPKGNPSWYRSGILRMHLMVANAVQNPAGELIERPGHQLRPLFVDGGRGRIDLLTNIIRHFWTNR